MKVVTKDNKTFYLPGAGHIDWFAAEVVPEGYLECNGAAISRSAYPELFDVIGTTYGSGNGTNTFNLPDLRGRFPEGADGGNVGVIKAPGLPNITGSLLISRPNGGPRAHGAFYATEDSEMNNNWGYGSTGFNIYIDAARANPIYGASDTVQPPALTLLPCIKY